MKTLIAIAVLGATLAGASGAIAKSGKFDAPMSPAASSQAGPKKFAAPRICKWPRISINQEKAKLNLAGYSMVKYVKTKVHISRCAKFLYFSGCQGANRYRLIVRFIGFKRYVIVQPNGACLVIQKIPGGYKIPKAYKK